MNAPDEHMVHEERFVEQFLVGDELEPEPENFTLRVMKQVRAEQAIRLAQLPRFRLTLVDYTLSLCAAAVLGAAWLLATSLPPMLELRLRLEAFYWLQRLRFEPQLALIPLGVTISVVGIGIAAWFIYRIRLQVEQ